MTTATPARIRRCNRDSQFAIAQNTAVLAARPDAKPSGEDGFVVDSFFDNVAHSQIMLNEKFTVLSADRRHEAAESAVPLRIGIDVSIAPILPYARMQDSSRQLDRALLLTGIAADMHTERNSIEAVG